MRRRHGGGTRDWLWLLAAAFFFLLSLILPLSSAFALSAEEQQLHEAMQSGRLIRLHIVAHSDSPSDQSVKLAVRDAVLEAFGQVLASSSGESFEAALAALEAHREDMLACAQKTAREHGFEGAVTAQTGLMELPEKRYGSVVLPKGEYHALRITLGSGKGRNWWCVLFPQLCLSLSCTQPAQTAQPPVWLSERIFQNWLLCPPVHSAENML